jgi:hypothetical protein
MASACDFLLDRLICLCIFAITITYKSIRQVYYILQLAKTMYTGSSLAVPIACDRQTLAVCKLRPPLKILRISKVRPLLGNIGPITEVFEKSGTEF